MRISAPDTLPSSGYASPVPSDVVATYIAEQDPPKRALLEKLHAQIRKALPQASVSITWGVPVFQMNGRNVCALAAFKDNVALNIFASPDVLTDPKKKL